MIKRFSIEQIDQLKKVFDVSLYQKCEKLNLVGWHNALFFRYVIRDFIGEENTHELTQLFDRVIPSMLTDPLPRMNAGEPELGKPKFPCITDLTIVDYWFAGDYFDLLPDARKACEQWSKQIASDNWESSGSELLFKSMHSHCIENGVFSGSADEAKVIVDLYATDDQLNAEFSEWLSRKRQEMKSSGMEIARRKRFNASELKTWCEKRVLAYIDLELVATHVGITLPHHAYGELIFPDVIDVDVTERIRKVVRPLARYLLNSITISSLQRAANRQYRESWNENR